MAPCAWTRSSKVRSRAWTPGATRVARVKRSRVDRMVLGMACPSRWEGVYAETEGQAADACAQLAACPRGALRAAPRGLGRAARVGPGHAGAAGVLDADAVEERASRSRRLELAGRGVGTAVGLEARG